MRRSLSLLGLLALLLLGALAYELTDREPGPVTEPARRPGPPAQAAAAAASAEPAPGRTQAELQQILARPLFEQDRRPIAETAAGPVAEGQARLAGILVSPAGRRAIFAPAEGKPKVLAEGDTLGTMTVQAIAPGAVTVLRHGTEQVLHPTYAEVVAPPPAPVLPFTVTRMQGVAGQQPGPTFTSSFAVPAAPPNLLGTAPAQPPSESSQ